MKPKAKKSSKKKVAKRAAKPSAKQVREAQVQRLWDLDFEVTQALNSLRRASHEIQSALVEMGEKVDTNAVSDLHADEIAEEEYFGDIFDPLEDPED